MTLDSAKATAEAGAAKGGAAYSSAAASRTWILIGFLLIHVLLHADRTVMSVLMEPVKQEFVLSDTYLGLFALAFALSFGLAGLPLGGLADQMSRRRLLAGCIAFFSLATAACGLAQNAVHLLLARFGVGAGESGTRPAILSIIADLFPLERRAFATSVYYLGIPIASIMTFLGGSWLAEQVGWRNVFLIVAAPGALAALATLFVLREPQRGASEANADAASLPWRAAMRTVLGGAAMRHVMTTTILTSMVASGLGVFGISFLVRSHGLSIADAGMVFALCVGGAGAVGALTGGWSVDKLAQHDERWRAWAPGAAALVTLFAAVTFTLAPSLAAAAFGLAVWGFATNWIYAPGIALTQSLAPPRARGTAAAIFYFLSNVAGFGAGPVLVGVLSDVLAPRFGPDSVRYAVLVLCVLYAWAGLHFFLAGRLLPKRDAVLV